MPLPQIGGDAFRIGGLAESIEHDVRAFGGEALGDAKADAGSGAGNECGLAFEHCDLPRECCVGRAPALLLTRKREPISPTKRS